MPRVFRNKYFVLFFECHVNGASLSKHGAGVEEAQREFGEDEPSKCEES